jgi:hypothetical protein
MTSWRHTSAFMVVVALMLDAYTGAWAQGSIKRTDTFEQRYPPDQVPTPPVGEKPPSAPPARKAPIQPPVDQLRARPNPLRAGPASSPGGEQPEKVAMATPANRASTRRSRLLVPPRSFLDARHRGAAGPAQVPRLRPSADPYPHGCGAKYGRARGMAQFTTAGAVLSLVTKRTPARGAYKKSARRLASVAAHEFRALRVALSLQPVLLAAPMRELGCQGGVLAHLHRPRRSASPPNGVVRRERRQPCRICATNCETLARFSPQTAKPKCFPAK